MSCSITGSKLTLTPKPLRGTAQKTRSEARIGKPNQNPNRNPDRNHHRNPFTFFGIKLHRNPPPCPDQKLFSMPSYQPYTKRSSKPSSNSGYRYPIRHLLQASMYTLISPSSMTSSTPTLLPEALVQARVAVVAASHGPQARLDGVARYDRRVPPRLLPPERRAVLYLCLGDGRGCRVLLDVCTQLRLDALAVGSSPR